MPEGRPARAAPSDGNAVIIGLNACVVAMAGDAAHVLTVRAPQGPDALPFGPFEPQGHRTLDLGLRSLVEAQTQVSLGYVEQLYTFGDRGRHTLKAGEGPRIVSVGYLALTRPQDIDLARTTARWRRCYDFFPWEDFRRGRPALIDQVIRGWLDAWAGHDGALAGPRRERAHVCFGFDGSPWDEEKVLERYELLYEAGLVMEARADGRDLPPTAPAPADQAKLGEAMRFDHRRILATALGRLRGKLKYRPVVFELMPESFTLLELQRTVEAITGAPLHKQNFRRLVESGGLVERAGERTARTGGRPAQEFRFRREVLRERPAPGVKVGKPVRRER
jgi:hypothetical protein